jgi:hypothetical protein
VDIVICHDIEFVSLGKVQQNFNSQVLLKTHNISSWYFIDIYLFLQTK